MATACLYCGLQFPDTAKFCPECGRTIEKGFEIRQLRLPEFDPLHHWMKGEDRLQLNCSKKKEAYNVATACFSGETGL